MSVKEQLKYTKDHEWVEPGTDIVKMGITEFAQSELGEIVFVDLPAVGKQFKTGDSLCVVESTKAASDVYAPISGEVVEVNSELASSPNLLNSSPLGDGWLVKIKISNPADLDSLMTISDYSKLIG